MKELNKRLFSSGGLLECLWGAVILSSSGWSVGVSGGGYLVWLRLVCWSLCGGLSCLGQVGLLECLWGVILIMLWRWEGLPTGVAPFPRLRILDCVKSGES